MDHVRRSSASLVLIWAAVFSDDSTSGKAASVRLRIISVVVAFATASGFGFEVWVPSLSLMICVAASSQTRVPFSCSPSWELTAASEGECSAAASAAGDTSGSEDVSSALLGNMFATVARVKAMHGAMLAVRFSGRKCVCRNGNSAASGCVG